jgi:hypothetical protein
MAGADIAVGMEAEAASPAAGLAPEAMAGADIAAAVAASVAGAADSVEAAADVAKERDLGVDAEHRGPAERDFFPARELRTVGVHQPVAKFPQEGSNHPCTLLTTEEGSLKPAWPIHGHVADALSETA